MDDDTYLNVPQLLKVLSKYNHNVSIILGKPSIDHAVSRKINKVGFPNSVLLNYSVIV